MKKTSLNLVIDAAMLLCMAAVTGIGLLIKYVLAPGFRRWEIYGRNVDLSLWGMGRHEWGFIHFVIGLILLILLIVHIVLHWAMIVSIYRNMISSSSARYVIAVILIGLTLILIILPFFVSPTIKEGGGGKGPGGGGRDAIMDSEHG